MMSEECGWMDIIHEKKGHYSRLAIIADRCQSVFETLAAICYDLKQ